MTLALVPGSAAERNAVIEPAIVTDIGCFSDHDAHAVVDEKASADGRPGMDLDPSEPPREMRDETRQPFESEFPHPMGKPVELKRVKSWITSDDFPIRTGCRITLENDSHLLFQTIEHWAR